MAGVLKLLQDKKANPPPARDERLPPKPAGQTVGSFRRGLTMLPEAIAANLSANIRCLPCLALLLGLLTACQYVVVRRSEAKGLSCKPPLAKE